MARCLTCHRRLRVGQPCPVHGGAVAPSAALVAAPVSWREPLGVLLGSGGYASVWALTDRVIKVAHASHELARARMVREADALQAIGTPAVPRCHDRGVLADGRAWIAMDRVVGESLADLTADGPMRTAEAVALGLAILDSLERVHAARFVHRDLKPDNLVRAPDGRVVILDLGLARKLPDDPDDPTRAQVQVGSLEYIAPEQLADSAAVDERSDIYAFGCVLYELLAGRPPFVGDAVALERAHTALRPPRLGALVTLPAAVESLVHDCLAKEPARRPASAAEVRERLAVARDERTPPRLGHTVSMIREGKQPVVLLWVELPRVDRAMLGALTGRRLVIASQRGRKVLAGVLGGEHADPASIAIATARELAAAGARVALHLVALRVSTGGGANTLHGTAVETPETWLPSAAWSGVVVTDALASVTQAVTQPSDALGPGFRALGDVQQTIELFGREALLGDLVADAAAVLHGLPRDSQPMDRRARRGSSSSLTRHAAGPAFALLIGEPGVGKTAFAGELAKRLGELAVRVHLGTVPPPGGGKPGHSALAELIGAPQGPVVRAVGDALRAAAREQPTAVILDDLHLAEHDLFDALEYATLGGEQLGLWVIGIASPRIDARRPQLGSRAERSRRDVLPPLDEDAAVALTAALLRPAEYPPLRALRRLAAMAHGNPLHLVMLAREIHQRGAIRERAGGTHFLDTSALDELSPAALGPWLAARGLADLSSELVALARLCAVVGGDVQRDELYAIVDAVERAGGATTTIDVDIGLRELVAAGILVETATGYAFRQALVEEGVYATTNEEERLALHRAALDYWLRASLDDASVAERVARHAATVDDLRTAAAAYARLGAHAFEEHRLLDADQAWSGALRHLTERDEHRARALLGRAQARYRLQRMSEALVDIEEAAAIAEHVGDLPLEITALIEQGTVLDFIEGIAGDFARSKQVAARARARLGAAAPEYPEIAVDLDLADARTLFREQKFAEGAPLLRDVISRARALGRHESATIGALLLGPVLSDLRELDEAELVFAEMIASCIERGDRWHLAAAYGNRAWLWSAKGEIDRTEEDLRLVIQLARESGQAHYERVATHNLGEHRLWRNQLDEALQLAHRGFALQSHAEGSTRPDRLLLARVLAARDDRAALVELLATFDDEIGLGPDEQVTLAILRAVAGGDRAALAEAFRGSDCVFAQMRIELGVLAARLGALDDSQRSRLVELAREDTLWAGRVGEL